MMMMRNSVGTDKMGRTGQVVGATLLVIFVHDAGTIDQVFSMTLLMKSVHAVGSIDRIVGITW